MILFMKGPRVVLKSLLINERRGCLATDIDVMKAKVSERQTLKSPVLENLDFPYCYQYPSSYDRINSMYFTRKASQWFICMDCNFKVFEVHGPAIGTLLRLSFFYVSYKRIFQNCCDKSVAVCNFAEAKATTFD